MPVSDDERAAKVFADIERMITTPADVPGRMFHANCGEYIDGVCSGCGFDMRAHLEQK